MAISDGSPMPPPTLGSLCAAPHAAVNHRVGTFATWGGCYPAYPCGTVLLGAAADAPAVHGWRRNPHEHSDNKAMGTSDQALVDGAGGAPRVGHDRSVDAGHGRRGRRRALLRDRRGLAGQSEI